MFDLLDNLVPMLIFFMLLRGILDMLLGKSKRRRPKQELPPDYEGAPEDVRPDYEATSEPKQTSENPKPDLATEFERRLKKRQQEQHEPSRERQKVYTDKVKPAQPKQERVYVDKQQRERQDKQRVHYDGELQHEGKGRIHRDREALQHDKSKLYRDPRGDYSYNEERFNQEAIAFAARYAQGQEQHKPKMKLKHTALVNGIVMAQLLDKPRSLKPYGTEEI